MNSYQSIFNSQKTFFIQELRAQSISSRIKKLKTLKNWIKKNEKIIC
ncbi:MAG: hypothetical protein ACJAWR_001815, partial [Flavobacteriales bacterium]